MTPSSAACSHSSSPSSTQIVEWYDETSAPYSGQQFQPRAYFGASVDEAVERLLDDQLADGDGYARESPQPRTDDDGGSASRAPRKDVVMVAGARAAAWVMRATAILLLLALMAACTDGDNVEGAVPADETDEGPNLASKPELGAVLPDDRGDPPSSLRVEDLVVGEGDTATEGAELVVHFVGASWSSGQEFDATWDRAQPYTFTLGESEVIPAWDEGLIGMRVGGRRVLVVPPEMGYGDRGSAAGIGPGETIVFIVDLLEVDG